MPTTLYLTNATPTTSRGTNTNGQTGTAKDWRAYQLRSAVGASQTTATVTATSGPTAGIEVGSPALEFISDPLSAAATVSGTVTFNIVAHESQNNANATIAVRIDRLDSTGVIASTVATSSFGTEVSTSAAARSWTATPTSTTFAKGDRIRIVPYFDDATGVNMGNGQTLTLTYNGSGTAANSYVTFNENLSIGTAAYFDSVSVGGTPLYGVARSDAESQWVLCGNVGLIMTSPDAVTWTRRTSPSSLNLLAVARSEGDDLWVIVGGTAVMSSTDGTTWTSRTTGSSSSLQAVARSDNEDLWVVVGANGTILTSPDAVTWTDRSVVTSETFTAVCRSEAQDKWVIGGSTGSIYTSADATTWTLQTSVSSSVNDIAYSATSDLYMLGTGGTLRYSSDAVTWTTGMGASAHQFVVAIDNGAFLHGSSFVYKTENGADRIQVYYKTVTFWRGAYSPTTGEVVCVASSGDVFKREIARTLYLTDTASDIADQGTIEKKLWTSRGSG